MAEGKYVIVQTAPAVRAAIAEEFGKMPAKRMAKAKWSPRSIGWALPGL
jgi:iron only hydrogenase large subunit-like protein